MKLISAIVVFIAGMFISVMAMYVSIYGMTQLFSAHALTVALMIGSIEFGKLVGSGWLKLNWSNPNVPLSHRLYLSFAIAMTMLLTSLGAFGFLSAGHLEQSAPAANIAVQAQPLELQLQQKTMGNEQLTQRLNQIDQNIAVFLKNDQASRGLRASSSLKSERDKIQSQIDANNAEINELNEKLAPLKIKSNEVEAKLGPVKYFAALVGLSDDSAVQLVIVLIVSVFDVFAVVLLLSALTSFREWLAERETPEIETTEDVGDETAVIDPVVIEEEADEPEIETESEPEPEIETEFSKPLDESPEFVEPEYDFELERQGFETEKLAYQNERQLLLDQVAALQSSIIEREPNPDSNIDEKDVDRDTLIRILERNPGILNEIEAIVEQDVVEELTDREKLIDLLEKNPAIINDMAEIIATQITKPEGESWLK